MLQIGQVPPGDLSTVPIDLIFRNIKLQHHLCTQAAPSTRPLSTATASGGVNLRPLADHGYLMNIGGKSHVAYSLRGGSLHHPGLPTCMFTGATLPASPLQRGRASSLSTAGGRTAATSRLGAYVEMGW
jgi:hypothetical protein